jgi:hypothetical protein
MPLALVRCGSGSPPLSDSEDRQSEQFIDAGAEAGCVSFADARALYAPARVCPTWVYREAAEDCSSWGPCGP